MRFSLCARALLKKEKEYHYRYIVDFIFIYLFRWLVFLDAIFLRYLFEFVVVTKILVFQKEKKNTSLEKLTFSKMFLKRFVV